MATILVTGGAGFIGSHLVTRFVDLGHQVRVLDKGFEFEGQPYRSLSAVAKAVTGSHWNGRAFFGLGKKATR